MSEASKAKFTKGPWRIHSRSEVKFGSQGLISVSNTFNNVEEYYNTALIASSPDLYAEIENDIIHLTNRIISSKCAEKIKRLEVERDRKCDLLAKAQGE